MTNDEIEQAAKASRDRQNKINRATQYAYRELASRYPEEFDRVLAAEARALGVELPPKRLTKEQREAKEAEEKRAKALSRIAQAAEAAGLEADDIVSYLDTKF